MWRLIAAGGIAAFGIPIAARAVWPVIRPTVKGFLGEARVRRQLHSFRGKDYSKAHDILIPGGHDTTQIDHVFVSRHGIFVIEAKNYTGDIYGTEKGEQWTQTFAGGRGYKKTFFNPLLQNKTHVKAIRALLRKYPNIPYYSIVAFGDNCFLPTIPGVLKIRHLKMAIQARCKGEPVLSREEVQDIGNILAKANIKGRKARDQHDAKAQLAADAARNVTPEMMEELASRAKTSPLLYFGEKREEHRPPPEQTSLTEAGAKLTIRGRTASIEDFFETAKRDEQGREVPKGAPFDHFICPFTGDSFPASEAKSLYEGLWVAYLNKNPELVQYLNEHTDQHLGGTFRCQRVLASYIQDPAGFTEQARNCDWYRNVVHKQQQKHKPLNDQIRGAEQTGRKPTANKEIQDPIDR